MVTLDYATPIPKTAPDKLGRNVKSIGLVVFIPTALIMAVAIGMRSADGDRLSTRAVLIFTLILSAGLFLIIAGFLICSRPSKIIFRSAAIVLSALSAGLAGASTDCCIFIAHSGEDGYVIAILALSASSVSFIAAASFVVIRLWKSAAKVDGLAISRTRN